LGHKLLLLGLFRVYLELLHAIADLFSLWLLSVAVLSPLVECPVPLRPSKSAASVSFAFAAICLLLLPASVNYIKSFLFVSSSSSINPSPRIFLQFVKAVRVH